MRPVIALDGDGVLLDYNRAYALVWARAFGTYPQERDPQAYWPYDRWDVERLSGDCLERFRACFDNEFWSTLPAIDGAVAACNALCEAGYELVCVTAMQPRFTEARRCNLRDLGFPIERVIATGRDSRVHSPKAEAMVAIGAVALVDDYLPFLIGVRGEVHTALVMREPNGTPNAGPTLSKISSCHADLAAFAGWWLTSDDECARPMK